MISVVRMNAGNSGRLNQSDGVQVLSAPKVTTLDARQAQIEVLDTIAEEGRRLVSGPSLDVIPIRRGPGSFELRFRAVVKVREPVPEEGKPVALPDSTGPALDNVGVVGDGDALVTREMLSPELVQAVLPQDADVGYRAWTDEPARVDLRHRGGSHSRVRPPGPRSRNAFGTVNRGRIQSIPNTHAPRSRRHFKGTTVPGASSTESSCVG